MTAGHALIRARRKSLGRKPPGAHALALTPGGEVLLVKLRYAPGWRLPGGGRGEGEALDTAALRELREEIGMVSNGAVTPLPHIDHDLVKVEDVVFRAPNWSWEIERVAAFSLDQLPGGLSPLARRWLGAFRP